MGESGEKKDSSREEDVLAFWDEHQIFEKSLAKPSPKGDFIFYDGPPGANGRPHVGHLETRAFKDALPRYKTMRGYHVARRAGWDTHGLPVELEVEKQLGFAGKQDIEAYGIAAFNKKCRESALVYIKEWREFSERVGYWVDFERAYFTFDPAYMESVWNIMKKVSDDGRLYKDYKVLPWCVTCGTALSSHELAQGYEEVKDLSVTVKFELEDEPGTALLAWTTTPWTLPGNIALAVGEGISYGWYIKNDERVIVANELATKLGEGWSLEKTFLGTELIGKKYKPLYPFAEEVAPETEKAKFEKAFHVYAADFVTTENGTGIVHTAVMYGADDFELGQKVGLPKVHLVAPDGRFVKGTGSFAGRSVIEPETNVEILKDLQARGAYFSKESYAHTYPHCWRSKNRLIYYARDSWYIRMQDLRATLLDENKKVNWEPAHIRDGRMGEWLGGAKDWALSRERYWGTPLPVWESGDGQERIVIGSIDELKKRTKGSGNHYFVMRHGEAQHNVAGVASADPHAVSALTEKGTLQAHSGAEALKGKGVVHIYASPLQRGRETAAIVIRDLGLPEASVTFDHRLREFEFGAFNNRPIQEFTDYRDAHAYEENVPGGESYQEVKKRFGEFLYEVEGKHKEETILIITHGVGFEALAAVVAGADARESKQLIQSAYAHRGELRDFTFVPLPHNEAYELDLHRPYIDEIVLIGDSGNELRRASEVMDVWFDSGAMPFAQDHYPFNKKKPSYPADFISEAIDQTRGWFYTLLAVGVLMEQGAPYKNVICLGHILDQKGQKMSKSKGNVVDPMTAMDQYGADTLRLWMYSVNQPGDSKSFDEKTVQEAARALSWLDNSTKFHELFKREGGGKGKETVLDTWMRVRTEKVVRDVTAHMDAYKPYEATRAIRGLLEDLSQWYVRRIRDRAREGDAAALHTLRETLRTSALLLAPFTPFIAEEVFRTVRHAADAESVHLAGWPSTEPSVLDKLFGNEKKEKELLEAMVRVRAYASEGLMLRQKSDIKVRQPLARMYVPGALSDDLAAILREEVNVKEIKTGETVIALDTDLTPDLIHEGDLRTVARAIAEERKNQDLSPMDTITLVFNKDDASVIAQSVFSGVSQIRFENGALPHSVEISSGTLSFKIERDAS